MNSSLNLKFSKNFFANMAAFLFSAVTSFFLSPFIVKTLGNTSYGVWVVLGSIVGYLGLLEFGVRGAVTRFIAHNHAVNNIEESTRIVSAGILLFGAFGLIAIVCSVVVAFLFVFFITVPETLVNEARFLIILGGLNIAVAMIGGVFGGVIVGLQRFDINCGIEIVITVIRTIAVIVTLNSGYGLSALGLIQFLSSILTGVAAWYLARRIYPQLRVKFASSLQSHMRKILSFGLTSSLLQFSGYLVTYGCNLIIGAFLPIGEVTFYAIASNLCVYAKQIISALSYIMMPLASALHAHDGEALLKAVRGSAGVASLITGPICVTFWWRGESFINLWMGPEYGATSGEILKLLSTVVWIGGARSIAATAIMGVNKHRILVPTYFLEAVCSIILIFVTIGHLGLVGVAIGTIIPNIIITLIYIPICVQKAIGIRVWAFFRDAWVLPALACVPFALATYLVEIKFPAQSVSVFFIQVIILLPLVPMAAVVLFLTTSEKREFRLMLRKSAHSVLQTIIGK